MIAVFFYHKTTRVPGVGLSPTVTALNVDNNTIVVNGEEMSESVLSGWYFYNYALSDNTSYAFTFDPNDSDYIYAVSQAFIPAKGGVGVSKSNSDFNATDRNYIKKSYEKLISIDISKLNGIDSHIDIAKKEITDKIDSVEIPETILEEKEAKKTLKIVTSIDKKLTSYIESEMKEKEEITQISSEFIKQEMEDKMKEKADKEEEKRKEEEEKKKEEEMDAKLLEEIKSEFEKAEEEDKIEKKKELEKELEETLKEAEEIKKELKKL